MLREPGQNILHLMMRLLIVSGVISHQVYKTDAAPATHKATSHYATWRWVAVRGTFEVEEVEALIHRSAVLVC